MSDYRAPAADRASADALRGIAGTRLADVRVVVLDDARKCAATDDELVLPTTAEVLLNRPNACCAAGASM